MEENKLMKTEKLKTEKTMYTSMDLSTLDGKRKLYNSLENADILLNDIVGTTIRVKDVYIEENPVLNDETGEVVSKYRTILFDEDGKTYATGAYGIYNSLVKIFTIFGLPNEWDEPIEFEVKKITTKDRKTKLVLEMK